MDIHELEVLVAVAEEKSFSRAAKTLSRTQPAVSQAIGRLESELDETLIDRSSKDGTLTDAGEVLVDYARQIINTRTTARSAIRELRDLQKGKISISANEHTVFFLLPLIERFRSSYPFVKIDIKRGVASRLPKELMAREVDLGVVSFKPNDSFVKSVAVGIDELALIVAPSHRFADRRRVSIKDLGAESFIAHNARSPYREQVIKMFRKYETSLNIAVEMPSLEAIKKLVSLGAGIALVPRLTAMSEIQNGMLKALSVKEMKLERQLHIVYRRNGTLSHSAKAFLKSAREF